jgi:hypothetical protein
VFETHKDLSKLTLLSNHVNGAAQLQMFKNGLVVTNEHQGLDLEQQAACVGRWIMILEVRDGNSMS